MRPLPRVLAFSDDRIAQLGDLGVRASAIAAAGPAAGLVARWPGGTADGLAGLALRFVALAAPPMAACWVTGRVDIAMATGAGGVIARDGDLPLDAMRQVAASPPPGTRHAGYRLAMLRSVHSEAAAETAIAAGADALVVGTIWASATHPGRAAAGVGLLTRVAAMGVPVYAIGGVTPERAALAKEAGAWGVAAIGAAWDAPDPYRATLALLAPWSDTCN